MSAFSNCLKRLCYCLLRHNAGINFIHNHPPWDKPPRHDLKGAKTLPPGQSLCTKTLPSGQNRESKAPPTGHKVRDFHKCIYELWHYLKWKALWTQQTKRFFNEETDYWSIYHLAVTRVKRIKALYIYKCMLIIFWEKTLTWNFTKKKLFWIFVDSF